MKIIRDTREQQPLDFSRWPDVFVEVAGLPQGDYSLVGLTDRFAVERTSLSDLTASVTSGRDRLVRELERLRGYDLAAIVVEASLEDVAQHRYRSKVAPESVLQTLTAWHVRYGVPTLWAGSPAGAAYMVRSLARHYLREAEKRFSAIVKAHGDGTPGGGQNSRAA
jgi:ERCC4-type nuclease